MEMGLLHLHNLLRWVILVLLIISIVKSYSGWQSKKAFTAGDGKTWLFTMIAAHITLLLGLYQWLFGRIGALTTTLPPDAHIMSDPSYKMYRFYWVEHPTAMILAIVFITLGRGMAKKKVSDTVKYKKAFWFFLIALLLVLAAIPWPFRDVVGRTLVPGM